MKNLLFTFFLFLLNLPSFAQQSAYQLTHEIRAINDTVSNYNFQDFSFKKSENNVLTLKKNHKGGYFFYSYSLKNKTKSPSFPIQTTVSINDFELLNSQLFYCTSSSLFFDFDLKTKKEHQLLQKVINRSFSKIERIDNQTLLLYDLYPYHPYDGKSQVYLYVFDIKKKKITDSSMVDFEGISLGNIVHQWLRVVNKNIYLVAPLSGQVKVYNSKLKQIDNYLLPILKKELKQNKSFVDYMDNNKKIADKELLDFRNEKGEKYVMQNKIQSSYYEKDALLKRMDTLRKKYHYIEKVFTYNDSTIILTIYRPEYLVEFRDVYFFNLNQKKITDSIIAWRCEPQKDGIIKHIENYFTVDLINSYLIEPFFYNGKVYAKSIYPIELFQNGTKKELDQKYFQFSLKKPVIWTLLEYTIKN